MGKLPLEGYRVIDFSWVFAGPTCTLIMATMGAEVIKIESSRRPDTTRRLRAYADGKPKPVSGGAFDGLNFSKRSITLDMTQPRSAELVKGLVKISDAVVENFSYGVMEKFGLGYPTLREIRPDLVMLSFSLFGREGPDKTFFGFGGPLPVFTGLASITGYPGGIPRTVGASWVDPLNGVSGAFALLAALHHRDKTGEGQYIDLSMCEGGIAVLPTGFLDYAMNRRVRGLQGNRDDFMAPHRCYPCRGEDKWVAIAVSNDEEWMALSHAMGDPEWTKEKRFFDQLSRWENQEELDELIGEWTKNYTNYEVMEILQKAGVPAGPTLDRAELLQDPHLKERELFIELQESFGDQMRPLPRLPWRLSSVPRLKHQRAPALGEHNQYVFGELLGLSESRIARLVEEEVIC